MVALIGLQASADAAITPGRPGQQEAIVEHDHRGTLPRGDIIGRAIVTQRLEVLADMDAKRIGVIARRFRLFKPAAHCCFFAIAKVE